MKIFVFVLVLLFILNVTADTGACLLNNAANVCLDGVTDTTCATYGGSINSTTFVNATLCLNVTGNPVFSCCQLSLDFTPPCQNLTKYECTSNGGTSSNSQICDFSTCPTFIGACTDPVNNTCTENLLASDCASYNSKSTPGLTCDAAYIKPNICHICGNTQDDDDDRIDCQKCSAKDNKFLESYVLLSLSTDGSVYNGNPSIVNGNIGGFSSGLTGAWPDIFDGKMVFNASLNPELNYLLDEVVGIYNKTLNCSCTGRIPNLIGGKNITVTHGKWCYYGDPTLGYAPMIFDGEIIFDGEHRRNPEFIIYSNKGIIYYPARGFRYINGAKPQHITVIYGDKMETSYANSLSATHIALNDAILYYTSTFGRVVSIKGSAVHIQGVIQLNDKVNCAVTGCCRWSDDVRFETEQALCQTQGGTFYGNGTSCHEVFELQSRIWMWVLGGVVLLIGGVWIWKRRKNEEDDEY